MVYRDAAPDARTTGLIAAVATHERQLEDRQRIHDEHDEVAAQIDELGRRLAAIERDIEHRGMVAALKRWIGVSRPEGLQRQAADVRSTLAERTARLAQLAIREKTITERLTVIQAAREELSHLAEAQASERGATGGPREEELRRLDAAIAATDARRDGLVRALAAGDRGNRAIADLRDSVAMPGRASSLVEFAVAPAARNPAGRSAAGQAQGRLRAHLGLAHHDLRRAADMFAALRLAVELPDRVALAELAALVAAPFAEPPEHSPLVTGIASAAVCMARLMAALNGELSELGLRRQALVEQRQRTAAGSGG